MIYIKDSKIIYINGEKSNYEVHTDGTIWNYITNKQLKHNLVGRVTPKGRTRCQVKLYHNNKIYMKYVSRLVAEAFIPNPENKSDVDHIDGDPTNNINNNLRWLTTKENVNESYKLGLRNNIGENNYKCNYNDKKIHKVCKLLEKAVPIKNISEKTGVSISAISSILYDGNRKYISNQYNIDRNKYRQKIFSDNTIKEIENIVLSGTDIPKEICNKLNIPYNNKTRHSIMRIRNRILGSTTIENNDDYYTIEIH